MNDKVAVLFLVIFIVIEIIILLYSLTNFLDFLGISEYTNVNNLYTDSFTYDNRKGLIDDYPLNFYQV